MRTTSQAIPIGSCVTGAYISGVKSPRKERVVPVPDNADDLAHQRFLRRSDRPIRGDPFSDRVLAGKKFIGECLIDYHYLLRIRPVGFGEDSAANERNAHGFEIAGAGDAHRAIRLCAFRNRVFLH